MFNTVNSEINDYETVLRWIFVLDAFLPKLTRTVPIPLFFELVEK
jgi:hypothetical protein